MLESQLILGDSITEMAKLPDKSIDMILCDLPYGITRNKWDSVIPLDDLWGQYERIIKDSGAIVLTAQTPFDKVLGASNLKLLRYEWIWEKSKATGHLNAKRMPLKNHENILIFYKKLPIYNPQGILLLESPKKVNQDSSKTSSNYGKQADNYTQVFTNYPKSIQHFASESKTIHPTQKPVALMEYLIKTYTNEGDLVLDNTMGSGTTCVAAANLGRRYIGIEKEVEYYNIAQQRVSEAETAYSSMLDFL